MGNMSPVAFADEKLELLLVAIGRIYELKGFVVQFAANSVTLCRQY